MSNFGRLNEDDCGRNGKDFILGHGLWWFQRTW